MSSSLEEPRHGRQIPLEEIVLATNNFADQNLIREGEFANVYNGKLLGSGQLGNIVLRRRVDSVYEPWEDEVWMQVCSISGYLQYDDRISIVGFCDENIIVYEHQGVEEDLSDTPFSRILSTRLFSLDGLGTLPFKYMDLEGRVLARDYFELVYMISLGDLMFQVLCDKKEEEHVITRMAMEHYETGELEKIVHPNLRLQMYQESFIIFSKTAYNCINQPSVNNIQDIQEGLEEALKLQREHERYLWALGMKMLKTSAASSLKELHGLNIPCEAIASATNNFGDENLIHKGEFVKVYKGKLLEFRQQEVIVVWRLDQQWEDELWMQVLEHSRIKDDILRFVGFCDNNIIVYEHVDLKEDVSDPTFDWSQRLQACASLFYYGAIRSYRSLADIDEAKVSATVRSRIRLYKEHLELVHMISLGDLMFQVLCGKKAEEQYPIQMAIEHYEKGELEKIMDPNLRLQMHNQSFTIFSKTAYNCIKQLSCINIHDIEKGLQEAMELQRKHELYLWNLFFPSTPETKKFKTRAALRLKKRGVLPISFEEIASATNNFGDENLIHKGEFVNVYKGKLLGSGQLRNIGVRRRLDRVYKEEWEDEFWMQVLYLSGDMYFNGIPFVGSCDENVIVYEHVGNGILKKDQSGPTFNWMERLDTCIDLASRLIIFGGRKIFISSMYDDIGWKSRVSSARAQRCMEYFELIYILSFGDLMFEVLCEKKAEEHAIRMAIEHYEKRELEKIMDPNLRLQMHQQSFTIFSKAAYDCIKQPSINNIHDVQKGLQEALKLQREHERYMEHNRIQLSNIMLSTNNFADECRIGSGAYGTVYKAKLDHVDRKSSLVVREDVAIKRIAKRDDGQGDEGFFIELSMLGSCEHRNIVSLLGFCYEGSERILVYEYAFKQSLNQYLGSTDNKTILTWAQRLRICLDIAYGLNYLHNNTKDKPRIIHRDIKSDNILLGEKWNAKIADFGLSKYHPVNQHASTINASSIAGTDVYLDPEYKRTGKLKKKSDIYSFGVVLFEILSGRLAYDPIYLEENGNGIAPIARQHFDRGTLKKMVDPQMKEADEFISTLYYGPNQDSLDTFSKIAYRCLEKSQAKRPTIEDIIKELRNALNFQENRKDILRISLEDIKMGTDNFNDSNCIIRGQFGKAYNGKVQYDNGVKLVLVKRLSRCSEEDAFLTELEVLLKHKHENVIDLVGYCKEENEKIIVYKHASIGSLDMHLSNVILGWVERLKICIDVASALDFLHKGGQGQEVVIHRDIKSASILLNDDWRARISDFGLSLVAPINEKIDCVINDILSTPGYCDPSFSETSFLTKESDIYSLGVVLFEILCRKLTVENYNNEGQFLDDVVKDGFEERELDEIVFDGIKQQIVPQSLVTFQMIAYECLHHKRENRPTACEVVVQLKKALEFQEEYEKWEPKLPKDYKQILDTSKSREIYSTTNKKDLYNMLSKGILIQEGRVWFLLGNDGERIEMLSSRMFSYKNRRSRKWRSVSESRFHNKVAEMSDISHLKIRIKRKIQSVSPGFNYRVHLVFKFCGPRKSPAKRMYVNLKYKKGSENLHTYFATWREDGWMMIELCRFSTHKGDVDFEVLLESFSPCESGSRAIYIEGIEFQAIDDVKHEEIKKLKEVQQVFKSNSKMDMVQQLPNNNSEEPSKTSDNYDEGEKLSEVNGKKRLMLLAKEVLYDSSSVKLFHLMQSTQSRFEEEIKLLPRQVFHIKCKIESQMLSPCTDYACYVVFKLSENCGGLHCPVKIRDLLHWKNKEDKILFFRSPNPLNQHDANLVAEQREDGLMEVNVWKFNSNEELRENFVPMNLKLIAYEGTMSGLIVYGLEVRPIL